MDLGEPCSLRYRIQWWVASGGNGQQLDGVVDSNYQYHIGTEMDSDGNLALKYAIFPMRITVPDEPDHLIDGLNSTGFDQTGHYTNIDTGSTITHICIL